MIVAFRLRQLAWPSVLLASLIAFGFLHYRSKQHQSVLTLCNEVTKDITRIYFLRARTLVIHNTAAIKPYYDLSASAGRYAFNHEDTRCHYIEAWEKARGIDITDAVSRIRITKVVPYDGKRVVHLRQTLFIGYVYKSDDTKTPNRFAIDTLHNVTVIPDGKGWKISKEWYLDPLKEDTVIPDVTPEVQKFYTLKVNKTAQSAANHKGRYNRDKAIEYAHRFCGVALTRNGKHYYNPRYRSYNGLGGDCTNFASQVLHEGGIPFGQGWHYYGSGSKAWVHTDTFANWLMYSGMGERVVKGDYIQVITPTEKNPYGAIQALDLGDLIGYEEKGDLVHFAVVVGRDSEGQLLVDTHTADRYKVPWDLGWDRKTIYWLISIKY